MIEYEKIWKKMVLSGIRFKRVVKEDLWSYNINDLHPVFRPFLFLSRMFYLIIIDFTQKKTLMMSSSLSYATVLGIVPVMLVVAALSKGFLAENLNTYTPKIVEYIAAHLMPILNNLHDKETGAALYNSVQAYINNELVPTILHMNLKEIGIYGGIILVVISFSLLQTIEKAFNDIWGVTFKRSPLNLILKYWMVIAISPILLLLILWITGFQVFRLALHLEKSFWFGNFLAEQLSTYITLWVLFAVIYKFVPNTRVRIIPALVGGFVGGTLWQLNNVMSYLFVSSALREHYLYGSLGIIPIFLIALFVGWLIILFGAHVSYAVQNLEFYRVKLLSTGIQPSDQQEIAVLCMSIIARRFLDSNRNAPSAEEISEISGLPIPFLTNALTLMEQSGFIKQTSDDPPQYVMSISPATLTLKMVVDKAIGHTNDRQLPLVSNKKLWWDIIHLCNKYRDSWATEANPTLDVIAKNLSI